MVTSIDTAVVKLWGHTVGAVSWLEDRQLAIFEYQPSFLSSGLDIAPIHMSLAQARQGDGIFLFPALARDTFLGLPGLLADCLPDKFGNSIIDAWLTRQGRVASSFSPVERLCYTGKRGMGALEFSPALNPKLEQPVAMEITHLVALAQEVVNKQHALSVEIGSASAADTGAILDILRVGTSAGGARPKAVIAMNADGHVLSGQTKAPPGYDYWILKFDGVTDLELGEPKGYGRIEYAYYRMALDAGIDMPECRLLEENGRAHFLARRFDRQNNKKIHMQSLCGIAHFDFNQAGAYSYEQAFAVMRKMRLSKAQAIELYRRMIFNVLARNQDDHTKNIAFLMHENGEWQLSPGFDMTYSHNPAGRWTQQHQMSLNGKRDGFTLEDLIIVGKSIDIRDPRAIIEQVAASVENWPGHAHTAKVSAKQISHIAQHHRLSLITRG